MPRSATDVRPHLTLIAILAAARAEGSTARDRRRHKYTRERKRH
jgi:hypothetical protein